MGADGGAAELRLPLRSLVDGALRPRPAQLSESPALMCRRQLSLAGCRADHGPADHRSPPIRAVAAFSCRFTRTSTRSISPPTTESDGLRGEIDRSYSGGGRFAEGGGLKGKRRRPTIPVALETARPDCGHDRSDANNAIELRRLIGSRVPEARQCVARSSLSWGPLGTEGRPQPPQPHAAAPTGPPRSAAARIRITGTSSSCCRHGAFGSASDGR
jgi:hypothetical protein